MCRIRSLWRNLVHRKAADADLDEELRAAFDLIVDEQVAAGVTHDEAHRLATIRLGRVAAIKTEVVQTRSGAGLEQLWHGLRLALGASRGAVLRSVLRQSLVVVAIGSAVGVPASMLLSRPLAGLLYGVTASDPAVLAGAVGCLFLTALLAAAVPAWRAARVDPLVALRHE